ncbi:TetR/AcrR family transcriptional regulator [Allokutzneria albata]|uniref:Regulatory protein, tetR family n=1 Tax=Allokutzneria albata TaxID=211114 RepID=A0A1G9TQI2_ALLAB|nr:TetR/AcrR family transcriptional regulator [Allokutzneria albata]SDM50059.1 regulatory protein, tetR family [Allokutzneria albata]
MAADHDRPSRAEQRRRTEARILAAARDLFAENGYDRTTIRAVAAAARTDPGLVMRYFGSKDELFARVAELEPEEQAAADSPEAVAELMLDSLVRKLCTESSGTVAMLRSMLTHPDAAQEVRSALAAQQGRLAEAIPGTDAELRAGLLGAVVLGTVTGRDLLRLDGLRDADAERIVDVLRPAIHSIAASQARLS